MRTVINVTKTIDIVLGLGRDLVVVAKRNATAMGNSVRTYLMRHALPAHAGSWLFQEQPLQPAFAAATSAAARSCEGGRRVRPAPSPSTRIR
jgi:hypothetical protein